MPLPVRTRATVLALAFIAACEAPPHASFVPNKGSPSNVSVHSGDDQALTHKQLVGDILSVDLRFDLASMSATGTYRVAVHALDESPSRPLTIDLEIDGLSILHTTDIDGRPLAAIETRIGKHSILSVEAAVGINTFVIDYRFTDDTSNGMERGLSLKRQNTLLWPDACSALYPCHSDPADGISFTLDVTGLPEHAMGLYPRRVTADAPSYMLAFAYGHYDAHDAGTTSAGTHLVGYTNQATGAPQGYAAHLQELLLQFDWLERTIGPYTFGDEVGTIVVANGFGGMEHHPIWYVEDVDSDAHEAAHGWFGNAVRVLCWEDLVLSEGLTEYLSIRVRRALEGRNYGYAGYLSTQKAPHPMAHNEAWYPASCDVHSAFDTLDRVYAQGSGFMMELATLHGEAALDQIISDFYLAHAGRAARMQDFIDFVAERSTVDVAALAAKWLL